MTNQIYFHTKGEGPDLVLIHGWGFNSEIWHSWAPILQKQYRVTILDLPGFGRSIWNGNHYQFSSVCEVLIPILPKQALYVGWSLGGLIATFLAIHYPEKVNALINICMSPCFSEKENWPGIPVNVLNKFIRLAQSNPKRLLLEFLKMQLSAQAGVVLENGALRDIMFYCGVPENHVLVNSLIALRDNDLRSEIKDIRIPQYYLLGNDDSVIPNAVGKHLLNYVNPKQIKMIPTGHFPFFNLEVMENLQLCLNSWMDFRNTCDKF